MAGVFHRPGVVDTSAVPTDQVNNPGTINALVNVLQRPRFADELIDRWRPTGSCPDSANEREMLVRTGKAGKC